MGVGGYGRSVRGGCRSGAAWSGDLRINGSEPALSRTLAAIRHTEWATGAAELRDLAASHPRHALVLLLLAWCREHNERIASREEFLTWLGDVAAGPAIDLTRFVARGNFASLRPKELYDILARQPSSLMEFEDWERLAIAAADAGLLDKALETIEDDKGRGRAKAPLRCRELRVDFLVQWHPTTRTASDRLGGRAGNESSEIGTIADVLVRHRQRGAASRLYAIAVERKGTSAALMQETSFCAAHDRDRLARWRLLLEAARSLPSESPSRNRLVETVLRRAIGAHRRSGGGRAGARLPICPFPRLLLRQAEIVPDASLASAVLAQLAEMDRISEERVAWACSVWNGQGEAGRAIALMETKLRAGWQPGAEDLLELERAYRARGVRPTPVAQRRPSLLLRPSRSRAKSELCHEKVARCFRTGWGCFRDVRPRPALVE